MLGPVLVVDPPPRSALRLLVVTFKWACQCSVSEHRDRRPICKLQRAVLTPVWTAPGPATAMASCCEPAIQFHGGRVQSGHRHFDFVLVLVKLPSTEGLL